MTALDSKFDLRQEWCREELEKLIKRALTKAPKTTRAIAGEVGCNIEQAKRVLNSLWEDGHAERIGETRTRVWKKA